MLLELTPQDVKVETIQKIKRTITKVIRSMAPDNQDVKPETITNWAEECHVDFAEVETSELNVVETFPKVGAWSVAEMINDYAPTI